MFLVSNGELIRPGRVSGGAEGSIDIPSLSKNYPKIKNGHYGHIHLKACFKNGIFAFLKNIQRDINQVLNLRSDSLKQIS